MGAVAFGSLHRLNLVVIAEQEMVSLQVYAEAQALTSLGSSSGLTVTLVNTVQMGPSSFSAEQLRATNQERVKRLMAAETGVTSREKSL